MKKYNSSKINLFKGKGLAISVTACAALVAAAGFITYNETAKSLENQLSIERVSETTQKIPSYEEIKEANKEKKDIEKETTAETEKPKEATEVKISVAPSVKQKFVYPVADEVIVPFSEGELVKSKTLGCWKTHDGVDIKAENGTPVMAITSGRIVSIEDDALWGVCIIIDHGNGIEGHYYGLAKNIGVKPDQMVASGEIIGVAGNTAECETAEEPHIHFGIKNNGEWINPIDYIRANM